MNPVIGVIITAFLSSLPFTFIAIHDPEYVVRSWAMIGMGVCTVAAMVAFSTIVPPKE